MPLDTQTAVQRHIQMEAVGTKNGTAFLCHLHHVFKSQSSGSIAVQPQRKGRIAMLNTRADPEPV